MGEWPPSLVSLPLAVWGAWTDMPRFFIDTDDGAQRVLDDEGYELPDKSAARDLALEALPEMARDKRHAGDQRIFSVSVRDESGRAIYEVELELRGRWVGKGRL